MKKVFTILSLILPSLFSCSSDEDNQYVGFDKSELEVGPESKLFMEQNELNEWHKLSEQIIDFVVNCSDDVKPYIIGQLETLTEHLKD